MSSQDRRDAMLTMSAIRMPSAGAASYARPVCWVANVRDAIDQRIADTDALDRDAQSRAMHTIIGVSERWLRETGSPYDPRNPRVLQLLIQAILWVEHGFGRGSVVAARIDLDEVGAGVVDVIVVPVTDMEIGRPRIVRDEYGGETVMPVEPRPVIAPATYIRRLDEAHGHHRGAKWRGVQDDWHAWCVAHLDARIQRGIPARVSGRRHLPRDQYAAAIEARKREAEEARLEAEEARRERDEARAEAEEARQDAAEERRERDAARAEAEEARRDAAAMHDQILATQASADQMRDTALRIQHAASHIIRMQRMRCERPTFQ